MRTRGIMIATAALSLCLPGLLRAQPAPRLSDKDVKELIHHIDDDRAQFENKLDGQIKTVIVRGPRGEMNMKHALHDLREHVDKLGDRFDKDDSASADARDVLLQASEIDDYLRDQPGGTKGLSEWDQLTSDLVQLAAAYGTTFPLPSDAAVRRINDREAAGVAESVARAADRLRKPIDDDFGLEKPDREAAKRQLKEIAKLADTVRSRAQDSRPATAEARQAVDLGWQLGEDIEGRALSPASLAAWDTLRLRLDELAQAYGMAPPPPAVALR